MIGPESTPSSTKWTVTPVTRAPWSSACRTASSPGNDGSSAGCTFTIRLRNRSTNAGAEQLHVPGEHDEVDLALLEPVADRAVARVAVRRSRRREDAGLDPGLLGARERPRPRLVRDDPDDLDLPLPVQLVEDRLQVGAAARGEHRDAKGTHGRI